MHNFILNLQYKNQLPHVLIQPLRYFFWSGLHFRYTFVIKSIKIIKSGISAFLMLISSLVYRQNHRISVEITNVKIIRASLWIAQYSGCENF
jgi:hypothetical protein